MHKRESVRMISCICVGGRIENCCVSVQGYLTPIVTPTCTVLENFLEFVRIFCICVCVCVAILPHLIGPFVSSCHNSERERETEKEKEREREGKRE